MIKTLVDKVFPHGTERRAHLKQVALRFGWITLKGEDDYLNWVNNVESSLPPPSIAKKNNPLISIVVPVYNPQQRYIYELVYSVMNQSYKNWELLLVNASDNKHREKIDKLGELDKRIRVLQTVNEHISKNTNKGIRVAKGEYIAFMDHDDVLSELALQYVVSEIQASGADLVYSDEDKITEKGVRLLPLFKPDWSPDTFLNRNYITHFVVVRKNVVEAVGGLRSEYDGAQDYDFLLRATELDIVIKHVPRILYHWRMTKESTAQNMGNKAYAEDAGARAIQDKYDRNQQAAKVRISDHNQFDYRTDFILNPEPKVAVILPELGLPETEYLLSTFKQINDYKNVKYYAYEKVVSQLDDGKKKHPIAPLENSKLIDLGDIDAEIIVVINTGGFPYEKSWLNQIVGVLAREHVAAVASRFVSKEGEIIDSGIMLSAVGKKSYFEGMKVGSDTKLGPVDWVRNVSELSNRMVAMMKVDLPDRINRYKIDRIANGIVKEGKKFNVVLPTADFVDMELGAASVDPMFNMNVNQSDYDSLASIRLSNLGPELVERIREANEE